MKKFLTMMVAAVVAVALSGTAEAGWRNCGGNSGCGVQASNHGGWFFHRGYTTCTPAPTCCNAVKVQAPTCCKTYAPACCGTRLFDGHVIANTGNFVGGVVNRVFHPFASCNGGSCTTGTTVNVAPAVVMPAPNAVPPVYGVQPVPMPVVPSAMPPKKVQAPKFGQARKIGRAHV